MIASWLSPRAVVFDIDGTLVDNMAIHTEAFAEFSVRHGLPPLTQADRVRLDGRGNSEIFSILFGRKLSKDEWRLHEEEKEGLYRELSRGRLSPMPGLISLLDQLAGASARVALATSAPAPNVAHTLAEIGLSAAFPVIVRADQVGRGKPAPDVFLEAARQLDVPPSECLAFEDAPMGIAAAHAARMPVVAITTSFSESFLLALPEPPDLTCPDFDAFLKHCESARAEQVS
ncbi:MAG: HAD family hydrolase [Vicinamibacterales bacterium]